MSKEKLVTMHVKVPESVKTKIEQVADQESRTIHGQHRLILVQWVKKEK